MTVTEESIRTGKNITALRKVFGIDQLKLAELTRIPHSTLCAMEKGRMPITDESLGVIADAFPSLTPEAIKNYDHEETLKMVIEHNTIDNVIGQVDTNTNVDKEIIEKLETLVKENMYLRMKYEPEKVEAERANKE